MKKINLAIMPVLTGALVMALAGCDAEREYKETGHVTVKGGQYITADMDGWVAVPNTSPEIKKSEDLSYAILTAQNIVPASLDGWVALTPAYFTKMAGVTVDATKAPSSDRIALKEGKHVPKGLTGWVAVPYSEPLVVKSGHDADLAMAELVRNQVVPKEMNGWVAVDRETLGKLSEKFMMSGKGADVGKK